METFSVLLLWASLCVAAPGYVAYNLGQKKSRGYWWVYWILGGWIGVIILALQDDMTHKTPPNTIMPAFLLKEDEQRYKDAIAILEALEEKRKIENQPQWVKDGKAFPTT